MKAYGKFPSKLENRAENLIHILGNFRRSIVLMNIYQAVNILTSLVVSVLFARIASQGLYGQYIFVISIVSMVSLVSMPGVRTTIFRSSSKGKVGFYQEATRFNFLWALLGVPLLVILGFYFYTSKTPGVGLSLIVASLFFPIIYAFQNWKNLLKGKERFESFVVYESSISITKALLVIGVLLTSPENLLYLIFVYFLAAAALNSYFYLKSLNFVSNNEASINWREESYEYTLLEFTSYTFSKVDRILIGVFLPFSQVAIYNIAVKVSDTLFKFIKSSIEAVLPGFFKEDFKFSNFYPVFVLLLLLSGILYHFIEYPLIFLYTDKYQESVFLAQIYLFAIPFYFMSYVSIQGLVKEKLSREATKSRIISILIFICLSLIMIPTLGVLGGIIASVLYYPFQTLFAMYYLKKNDLI
ncbi:MAG: O-antigen/teichoic acid export membrane protein [Candidatus Nanohaloarchaea archaeon]|jgi:O-antigen/teichoic acid export membrane protein